MNNPPLQMYAVAAAGAVSRELAWLRGVHIALWVAPLFIVTAVAARQMFGARAALFAVLALFTQEELLREAAVVKLDVPLATLATAFVFAAWKGSARWIVALAVAAALVRYQGAFVGGSGFLVLLLLQRRRLAVLSLAGAAAGVLAWFAFATACGGSPLDALATNFGRLSSQANEPWFHKPILTYWRGLAGWVGPLLLAGVVGALLLERRTPRILIPLAWVAVDFAFCSLIGLKAERYFAPALPALAIIASSIAAPAVAEQLKTRGVSKRIHRVVLPLAVIAALASLATLYKTRPKDGLTDAYRRVGERVAALTDPDDRILLPHVQVAWFARRPYYVSVFEPDPDVVQAWLDAVEVVVTDDRILTYHPNLGPADRNRLDAHLRAHFRRVESPPHANILVRVP
jgi:4-amino-4-deoxy-L-arabinose transferase-like glycosyltransferase